MKKNVEDFPRRSAFTFFLTTINQGTISVWEKLCLEHKINNDSILLIQTFAKLCLVIHASNKIGLMFKFFINKKRITMIMKIYGMYNI